MKKIFKQILSGIFFVVILAIIFGSISVYPGSSEKILKIKDENTFNILEEIKTIVKNSKATSFNNLNEFNKFYNKEIDSSTQGCYYLKSFNNNKGFVFASLLNSRKYIKEYGEKYFIYKSVDNYVITDEEMVNIINVINNFCE